jgi:hypothetical protein
MNRLFRAPFTPTRFRPGFLALEDRSVPAADLFANATLLEGSFVTATASNVGTTAEPGEPAGAGTHGVVNSVWWSWTAPVDGPVEVNTFGSELNTVLGVYTGDAVDQLTLVAANDDALDTQSQLVFEAVAGETYRIAVDGSEDSVGDIMVRLGVRPANDEFAGAVVVEGGTVTGHNMASTFEDGEPTAGTHGARNTVWWSWTAPASETVEVSTIGSDIDTVLAIYTGDAVDDLTLIAVNHDIAYPTWLASRIAFNAVAGTTYRIAVDGDLNEAGPIVLNLPGGSPENSPPEIAVQTFDVDENSAAGTVVGAVAASDPDPGQSLSYAITGGNESGAFAIDGETGEISVVGALDHEAIESYVLTIEVTDDGSPALSVAASVTVNVVDVNEAPVLDNTGSMTLDEIGFGQTNNPGTLVADLIASAGGDRISDPDAGAVEGIAITAANTANGSWQFSTDGGATWQALGAVSNGSARLLTADARVRFVPNFLYSGTVTNALTFRAWDQTSGVNGGLADTTVNGGASAFSIATETASLRVRGLLGLGILGL